MAIPLFLPFVIPYVKELYTSPTAPDNTPPIPYQQPSITIPHLFTAQQEEWSTPEWYAVLMSATETYECCEVVSITTAKALRSSVFHEFVQFIVEDTNTGTRTRVFTDRTDSRTPPDRVIVGRDWASSKNPSNQDDMPMPLMSMTFPEHKRPGIIELAKLLACTTLQEPEYGLISTNCWWYAKLVFETAKAHFGNDGVHKEWPFARYANSVTVCAGFITERERMEMEARAFKHQNVEKYDYQVNDDSRGKWTTDRYFDSVAQTFNDEKAQEEYEEAMQLDSSEKLDSTKASGSNATSNLYILTPLLQMLAFLNKVKEAPPQEFGPTTTEL